MNKSGLFVMSGPSGAGKTTLVNLLLNKYKNNFCFSVSHTSRLPREGEKNGIDYFFISKDEFENGIKKDIYLEYATVHGNYYGTSKEQIDSYIKKGINCILDIDVQGAITLMNKKVNAIYIFIAPPSIEDLKKRLYSRSTDTNEVIEKRLKTAISELEKKDIYDYIIINDNLDRAFKELENIVLSGKSKK